MPKLLTPSSNSVSLNFDSMRHRFFARHREPDFAARTNPFREGAGWALFLSLLVCGLFAHAALPPGWKDADIGAPALAGSADYSNGVWVVTGSGSEVCTSDQLHFAWNRVSADVSIIVRVNSVEHGEYAQGGLMFRSDITNKAVEAALLAMPTNGISFQWRAEAGQSCSMQLMPNVPTPVWLRLCRAGTGVSAWYGNDGLNWFQMGSTQTVSTLGDTMLAGLAVCSQNTAVLSTATFTGLAIPPPTYGIYREKWTNLPPVAGNSLAALTNTSWNPNWPNNPETSLTAFLPEFETETDSALSYYGQRLRTFIVPPQDGTYKFSIASDDTSELLLSTDETVANVRRIAWVGTSTLSREWTKEPNQVSASIPLQAGVRYYLEGRMQQGTGADNFAVQWMLPSGQYETPLASAGRLGTRLVPCTGAESVPGVFIQPTNQVVSDGLDAMFALLVTNQGPVTYRWRTNGTDIPGTNAAQPVYTVRRVSAANQNQVYTCAISNNAGFVVSAPAVLSVLVDTNPPLLTGTFYINTTNVALYFSEALELATATNVSNYTFSNGLGVAKAAVSTDGRSVTLTTSAMQLGSNYVILLNRLRDRATSPNTIAPNTAALFTAAPYAPIAIGSATPPGWISAAGDGYDVSGGGRDIGGISDQFQYAYELRDGDFDVRLRLEGLDASDSLAKAGLMVREALTAGSRYAAVLATPSFSGVNFQYRTLTGGTSSSVGNAPVNYPQTWLRLQRRGDLCSGYASYDGNVWQMLGSVTLPLTNPVYFGLAVCSRSTDKLATARFRAISDVTNAVTGTLAGRNDIYGPSSRRTGLTITEIMYHPAGRSDGKRLEFIEIFNTLPFFEDVSGYRITGDISYTFPPGTIIPGGTYLVVAAAPDDLKTVYRINNVFGPYTNNLPNSSGTVRLRNKISAVLLDISYDSLAPWPAEADGAGHSLVLAQPSYGEGDPRAWGVSDLKGGSPGSVDGLGLEPARGVVINEVLAHTDPPLLDQIELFNSNSQEVDLSGYYLTDDPETNKFRLPPNSRIPGRGFVAYNETQLGFRLDAGGETVYLVNPAATRVINAVRFEAQDNPVSAGRCPDGAAAFRPLATTTLGTNNSAVLRASVVINEIMYFPISLDEDDQYVELHNTTTQPINLGGWSFLSGIQYTFPSNAVVGANGYVVVSRNTARMLSNYPSLSPAIVFGDFGGRLARSGEKLVLGMPEALVVTNTAGTVSTNIVHVPVSEVTYGTGGRWGQWAHGGGSSLELRDPRSDTTMAANWADSDETAKAPWSTVEYTGVLDNGGGYSPDQLQLFMMGEGECLVDSVEVFRAGEANRLTNPEFNNAATGWFFQGTHRLSGVDNSGGYGGGPCLHVRASGRGDTGANRIRTVLSTVLPTSITATLRAKVRWLKGDPEILLRLHGNWLEAAGRFTIPANLGTPGARNSRFIANGPPAIADVTHTPPLPGPNQPVVVSARVHDPDNVGPVTLHYRNDTAAGSTLTLSMLDDGTGGDRFAKDGIYSATIPGHASGVMVAFYVQAADAVSVPAASTFPNDAPARECLVRFGDTYVAGVWGNYRLWITSATQSRWASRERNSNEPLDATFVYGNFRPVYNMRTLYSGSPFHTGGYTGPTGNPCDYVLSFPDDDRVLGVNDYVISTLGNLNNDNTYQREQAAFWVLREVGVPSLYRRYIVMFVNGVRRGTVLEDSQQPSGEIVDEYFPEDNDGFLHKIEDWFEFDNGASGFSQVDATLDNFTTTGGEKKLARYRWNWRPRAVKGSSNNFTNLFNLVDAVHLPLSDLYTTAVEKEIEVDEWMRVFALERLVGNWDSYSYQRGKNMYAYKPLNGRWQLMAWDIDFVWDLGGNGPTTSLFGGQDYWIDQMRSHPPFRRAYWRAFQDILDGPLQESRINAMLDAKYAGLVANGVNATTPGGIKGYINTRRGYLINQLATVAATFNVSSTTARENLAEITGTAPVKVKTITFNGNEYPVTWTSVTAWKATVPLQSGSNPISIVGIDSFGKPATGSSNFVTLVYQGSPTSPVNQVVINEIMAAPKIPDAEYVELFNTSSTLTFDLSGWEFRGLNYSFPGGSTLGPGRYLVLAKDPVAFTSAYGGGTPVFGVYGGNLQSDGETLTLIKPGPIAGTDLVIDKVRYRNRPPWPHGATNTGASLQLIDYRQDNWRAGNWTVASTNAPPPPEPQWVYVTATGTASSTPRLYLYLQSAGDIYIDDMQLVEGSVPGAGANLLVNGGFESALAGTWNVTANFTQSTASPAKKRSGNSSLHMIATAAGAGSGNAIYQEAILTSGQTYALSFWYLQSTNGGPLTARLSGSGLTTGSIDVAPPSTPPVATPANPGANNSVARALPAFPPLYINEIQAQNLTGITNRAGQRTPWVELFNPSTNAVSLDGLYLANQYNSLLAWAFPPGIVMTNREFKVVFLDSRTDLSTISEPHANFTLAPAAGSLALTRVYNSEPQVLDYIEYTNLLANQSYGSVPDAQSFDRQAFFYVTPRATNNAASAPLPVVINEWMASNTSTLTNPVTGKFGDWFELYNYSTNTVDLAGYYLTDTLTNQFKFPIPAGYTIPPKGFLLVWADKRNTNGTPELHVDFNMDKDGESLGLYGADGRAVDYVNYGPQFPDVSEGRYPDGSFSSFLMPVASPGTNNVVPNSAPRLDPIADKVLMLGQSLRFTATASDTDLPPQALTFSLGPNPPPGASIGTGGLFLWAPTVAPVTNNISVVVTDSGIPPMSSTNTFTVRVYLPPELRQVDFLGDGVSFTIFTAQGLNYQLEYCDDLVLGAWFVSGAAAPGNGGHIVLTHEMTAGDQRYYRVRVSQ
jgi:regulation of enolase protein 1 (concanavalin A-like superfamily)